jgi:hypothetical protein
MNRTEPSFTRRFIKAFCILVKESLSWFHTSIFHFTVFAVLRKIQPSTNILIVKSTKSVIFI